MKISLGKLGKQLELVVRINEVAFVAGSPGIGKSATFYALASKLNLLFIDFRLSLKDPVDITGFPFITTINGVSKASYTPFDTFPLATDPLPEGKDGWLISFEEINSVPPALQAAAYQILHDRMVGDKPLHPAVRIVANGNLESDGAVVMPMSSALASRMVQYETYIDPKEFLEWATLPKVTIFHPLVLAYLSYENNHVHLFDPNSNDKAFPAPRTWEKVSKMLFGISEMKLPLLETIPKYYASIAGAIGEAVATNFMAFINYFNEVTTIADIIAGAKPNPQQNVGIKYANALNIANNFDVKHAQKLLDFVYGLNANTEYLLMTLRMLARKDIDILDDHVVDAFIDKHADGLFRKTDYSN